MINLRHLLMGGAVAALAACAAAPGTDPQPPQADAAEAAPETAEIGTFGIDLSARDTSVAPGDDFDRYANGSWQDEYDIPADLSSYGIFVGLRLDAEDDVRAIVEDLSGTDATAGSVEQKVGDAYSAWMDLAALDARGATPLQPHLETIYAIGSDADLTRAVTNLHSDAPFGFGIIPDPADTTRYLVTLGQSGLGMPNRDYYLEEGERYDEYRSAYRDFVVQMFTLAGLDDAGARAERVIDFETRLAEAHWTDADNRDIAKIYNIYTPAQLKDLAPSFDWDAAMEILGLDGRETLLVAQPSAIAAGASLLTDSPDATVKDYLAFQYIASHASSLSGAFDDAQFAFYGMTLSGTQEKRDRWKRGVNYVNGSLGELVGQVYVDRHFPPASKAGMEDLVATLTAAFEERLEQNPWMDEETRQQALLKLSTFEPRIGYPDKWIDYSALTIEPGRHFENRHAITDFNWQRQVDRLDLPVDRQEWGYPPQTVNASYNPLLNQITFPAGILQPPFFDRYADPAVNFGAIGAVIGHEIGHGFDDQGRRFDEEGRIRDWWTAEADANFQERADRLGEQYAQFEPIEGLFVKPDLTMGENIGDLGGLQMAYAAYRRYLDQCCGGEAPVIDGMTADQRFFLAWAQVWRGKQREDALRQRILTDPHSPPTYRINGVVRNIDAWYDAFDVQPGDDLYLPPEERVRIW